MKSSWHGEGLSLKEANLFNDISTKFWDSHLKAIVFKKIDFVKQCQQYCTGLTKDIRSYVNDQKPCTIAKAIDYSKVVIKIFSYR